MTSIDCSYSIKGSGPAIVFVHGIGARKTAWNKVCKYLEKDFTCVCYDLRGHGDSSKGMLPYSLEALVDDVESLRQKLGIQKIHIVGHSLGGMIGPAYALSFPENVVLCAKKSHLFWVTDLQSDINAMKMDKIAANREDMFLKSVMSIGAHVGNQKFNVLYVG